MTTKGRVQLSRKMLTSIAVFSLFLFLSVILFLGFNYYYTEKAELSRIAFGFARSAASYISGDKIEQYLDAAKVTEDGTVAYAVDGCYGDVQIYLTSIHKEQPLMKYYYVFVPNEDTVTYLWDATIGEGASHIGDTEEYMDGGKEAVERIYNSNPVEELRIYKDDTWGEIACAFYPIYNGEGEPVAVVGVDYSMEDVRNAFIGYILTIVFVILTVLLIASFIFYMLIRKSLVEPIDKLNKATQRLVQNLDNDETFSIDIHTNDELEDLANSFARMDGDLKEYIKRISALTAEKERISAELDVATQIQADMLPRIFPAFPDYEEFDIYATMSPAKEVGGDFYDFFLVDDDHIALVMADVSGKGVPAALFMVIAKTLIKNHAQLGESPAEILKNVNEQLCEGNEAELFVTVWLAVIEISTGKGVAANAGHEHPALRRANGNYELVIYRHSPAVATMEGMRFREHEFELHPGDSLFVYTDGVAEATDNNLQLFSTDRMLTALNRNPAAAPEELLKNVRYDIDTFVGDADQFDDITMLGFHYKGLKAD